MPSSFKHLVDRSFESRTPADILDASPEALQGVSEGDAEKLAAAFGIRTVADLSRNPFFHAARAIDAAARHPPFDPGPPADWLEVFGEAPLDFYTASRFRFEFGPVYYRGRLDRTARVLVIGQDPSTNEILAQRNFVGNSGQRVQKLLAKLGITRSYVMINTFLVSVHGQFDAELRGISLHPRIMGFRHRCLDKVVADNPIEAVIAFGAGAKHASENWPGGQALPFFGLTHPAASDSHRLPDWNGQLGSMAQAIEPDFDGVPDLSPITDAMVAEGEDMIPIPRYDLPFGIPDWHGAGGGSSGRNGNNTIVWTSPLDG